MKTITLVKIGAIGGFITAGMGLALQSKLSNQVKNTAFYKTAMDLVRHNKAAIYYLGEPIRDKSIESLNSKKNYIREGIGKFEVRLKGSKQNGTLHIFIKEGKVDGTDGWKIEHLELAFDKDSDKRLLINTNNAVKDDEYSVTFDEN